MSKVYVLFVKQFGKEGYVYLPTYEVHYEPVTGKVAELDVGDCIDTFKCSLAEDGSYVIAELWNVSNIGGKAVERHTETMLIDRAAR
jgi:hypothetical protein